MTGETLYNTIRETVWTYIEAYSFSGPHGKPNIRLLTSLMSPEYQHSWGHNHMIRDMPRLQGVLDGEGFAAHLGSMVPHLESCRAVVHDMIVDAPARKVVVRNSFFMCPRGQGGGGEDGRETVENDVLWIFGMDESGSRIESAMEFLDAAATERIGELIAKAKERQ
ncbi:hypothetical protein BKA67DRAFT_665241 [Truncatella angustata]|uniref:SnoaL-like domain-containing protein n=1 Tax=Truncatella angustata TaxID=152316 RepID=A0A9P8RFC9_9PEZI|nr:uncharacterized protein BKA67DRAFT_665241 [Truncatella angustata]KAH6643431.1 hypothetical protein BKA67DRAFT_665241 [Truncatella angustata]KAH8202346.1 hypothetical protein TruAng_003518 [Truncatella angustata]